MRTSVVPLFALAGAAVPGSLLPHAASPRSGSTTSWPPTPAGPLYGLPGLLAVYTSPWFSAIYLLLLLVSLIGCILPHTLGYATR